MSRRVSLSTEETYELAERMEAVGSSKLTRRLLAISLRHFGYKIKAISGILNVSERSISTWIKTFNEGGFDGLLETHYQRNRNSKLQPYQEDIRAYR
ncbi:MAG: helix-turn-helix domain-containing protein, partial [Bacteroidota bacterium]